MPVKGKVKQTETLVVDGAAKEVAQDGGLLARGLHRSQAGNGHAVQPRPHVGRQELVEEHADVAVPKGAQGLRALNLLPVQTLQRLDRRQRAPVDRLDVPHGDRAQDAAEAVAEQANGDGAQDNGGGRQRQVVEQVLGSKDGAGRRRVGGRRRRDGADGVLLERPGAGVEDPEEAYAHRWLRVRGGVRVGLAPLGQRVVAARKERGPGTADEVGNEHDKRAGDGGLRGLEVVDLRHDGLEGAQDRGQQQAAQRDGGVKVVTQWQQMGSRVGTRAHNDIVVKGAVGVGEVGNLGARGRGRDGHGIDTEALFGQRVLGRGEAGRLAVEA